MDAKTDFSQLYGNEEHVGLIKKKSSLMREESIIGKGKHAPSKANKNALEADEYYDEMITYKQDYDGEVDDEYYGEEAENAERMVIERNVEPSHHIENPDREMVQALYERTLERLVDFLDLINSDELSFMYK